MVCDGIPSKDRTPTEVSRLCKHSFEDLLLFCSHVVLRLTRVQSFDSDAQEVIKMKAVVEGMHIVLLPFLPDF